MTELAKLEDLKFFLQSKMGVRISIDDLKTANPDVVQKIYITFLKSFNFRVENFHQIPFGFLKVPDAEMFQETIPFAALAASLDKIVKSCGGTINVYLCDILDPKPKKFKIILSYLCQLFLFWESRMNLFDPIKARYEGRKQMEQKLEEESEELKCEINRLQHDINETEERLEKASEVETKLSEITKERDNYIKEKDLLKGVTEEMSNRLANILEEQKNLPDEIESLKSRLRQPLPEIEREVQEWETKALKWEEKCNELRQRELNSDYMRLEEIFVKLEEVTKDQRPVCAKAMNLLNRNKSIPSIQKDIETTKAEIMDTEKSISQKQEIINMLKQQNEKQLWRRQCQIEEKNAKLVEKEGTFFADETTAELKQFIEKEAKFCQENNIAEDELVKIKNDFTANFNILMNTFKESHKKKMKAFEKVLGQIDSFYD